MTGGAAPLGVLGGTFNPVHVAHLRLAQELAGIPVGKFTVFAGALGVGLGFGLQAIFSNFVSGLILLFDRSLKVGDFVELDAQMRGTVRAFSQPRSGSRFVIELPRTEA